MREYTGACSLITLFALLLLLNGVNGDNPYRFYTWKITYGDIYPLGVKQQVLLMLLHYVHCLVLCSVSWIFLNAVFSS